MINCVGWIPIQFLRVVKAHLYSAHVGGGTLYILKYGSCTCTDHSYMPNSVATQAQ